MEFLIDKILFTIPVAIIFLTFGVIKLRRSIKELQEMDDHYISPRIFIDGLFASLGTIALGIIIIYFKIKGEW
jgi:hypothetical protein